MGVVKDAVSDVIGDAEEVPAVVNLGEGDSPASGHHEELTDGGNPRIEGGVKDGLLLEEEVFHEVGEPEPDLAVRVAIKLEEGGVALNKAGNLAAAREAKLTVELASIVKEENVVRLPGEEVLGPVEKSEEGVTPDDIFEVVDALGLVADGVGAGAVLVLVLQLAPLLAS